VCVCVCVCVYLKYIYMCMYVRMLFVIIEGFWNTKLLYILYAGPLESCLCG